MEKQLPVISQIEKQIQHIEYLFENKQLDQFVEQVQRIILPHYQKCHISGKYKEKIDESTKVEQPQQGIQQNSKQQPIKSEQTTQKVQEQKLSYQQKKQQKKLQINKDPQKGIAKQQQAQNELFDSYYLEKLKIIESQSQEFHEIKQSIELTEQQSHKSQQEQETNQNVVNYQIEKHQQILLQKQQIAGKNHIEELQQKISIKEKQKPSFSQSLSQQIKNAVKNSKIHILEKYDEMKLVIFKIQREMKKLETPMSENKDWKVNKINATSSIGVKTKGTLVQIRYEGVVQTNIFNLCVMIYLSELYKEWVPFCSGSKTITQPSPLQKLVLMDLKIPFLTQRYAYLHGIAIDRITKNGKLYIYAEGISHEKELLIHVHKADKAQYEKKVAKSVVLDAKYMVCEIGNQGNGKYSVKVYGMLDSHMPLLPEKVVNYIVKQLGGMIFDKIVKRAKDIKNTPWQKQLKENQKRQEKNRFYSWLDQRIKNWDKSQTLRKSKI